MDFFVSNAAIILLAVTGIALVVVEMFLPGISIPGIAGAIMLFIAIWLIWANYGAFWGLIAGLSLPEIHRMRPGAVMDLYTYRRNYDDVQHGVIRK